MERMQRRRTAPVALELAPETTPIRTVVMGDDRRLLVRQLPPRSLLHPPTQICIAARLEGRLEEADLLEDGAPVRDVGRFEERSIGVTQRSSLRKNPFSVCECFRRRVGL
jgi:hypothetical protein